jgi:hypothetical protein
MQPLPGFVWRPSLQLFQGGYSFYHPVELFCIRFGFLTALLGLVASVVGKGRLRLHVAAISTVDLLLWLVDAAAQ